MIMLAAIIAIGALLQIEAPRTVNGQVLGKIEEYQDRGPARICLDTVTFDILEREVATLQYAGIHSLTVRVSRGAQFVDVALGNAWAKRRMGRVVLKLHGAEYRRTARSGRSGYTIFARTDYSDGKLAPVAMISGSALVDDKRDMLLLERIQVAGEEPLGCTRRYAYGWDMLFGDEPLSRRAPQ